MELQSHENLEPRERRYPSRHPNGNGTAQQRVFDIADEEELARGLGWFSIGLGLTEIMAPRLLARLIGVRPRPALFCFLGIREIASGVGILTRKKPAGFLWSRVAGDMMDLSLLGAALKADHNGKIRLTAATAAVAGVTALDVIASQKMSQSAGYIGADGAIRVRKTILINRPPEEVYKFWRAFENLPLFMYHLESVQLTGERRSHWVAKAPAGARVEWDAEIVEDRPNEAIAWRTVEGSDVEHSGVVEFERAPGGRGTFVEVELQYKPPAGVIGAAVARLFGKEPGQQVQEDLRRLKQILEAGEIVTTEGQPAGPPRSATGLSWKYDQTARRDAAVSLQ